MVEHAKNHKQEQSNLMENVVREKYKRDKRLREREREEWNSGGYGFSRDSAMCAYIHMIKPNRLHLYYIHCVVLLYDVRSYL